MKNTFFFACALVVGLAGCSSSSSAAANQGPVIDSVMSASTVMASSDGSYKWTGTLNFHDPEMDAVAKIHLVMKDLNIDQTQALTGSVGAVGIEFALTFPKGTPTGAHAYSVSLIDDRGAEGAPSNGTITFQ